jgi:hypothetical protein
VLILSFCLSLSFCLGSSSLPFCMALPLSVPFAGFCGFTSSR